MVNGNVQFVIHQPLQLISYGESTDTEVCPLCDGLYRLGKQIVDSRETVFVLASPLDSETGESIPHIEVYVNNPVVIVKI